MNLRKAGWISLHVVAVLLILSAELRAQNKAAASTDDLLKSIGMKSGPRDWSARDVVDVFRKLIGETVSSGIVGASLELEPTTPMPSALRAKGGALLVRSQQDPFSEAVAKLPPNEEVTPIGKASGAGEIWYMVRTKSGAIGWVRGVEVEDVSKQR
jgi:hypothetical protein